jgi:hypothetical protein
MSREFLSELWLSTQLYSVMYSFLTRAGDVVVMRARHWQVQVVTTEGGQVIVRVMPLSGEANQQNTAGKDRPNSTSKRSPSSNTPWNCARSDTNFFVRPSKFHISAVDIRAALQIPEFEAVV